MQRLGVLAALAVLLGAPAVYAQGSIEDEIDAALSGGSKPKAPPAGEAAAAPAEPAATPEAETEAEAEAEEEALPQIGEDQLAVFVLQRGFYVSGDLGILMTFGGTRGYSNLQPYVGVKAGFDINDFIGVALAISSGYSSGDPLSDNDAGLGVAGQEVINYGLFSFGAEVIGSFYPNERFAIEPKLGGGMTRIHPTPHDPDDPNAYIPGFLPHVAGGVDFKYLTLLTDFIAGVSLTAYYIIGPKPILAGAGAFVVRYTF